MMNGYILLADAVSLVHLAYVSFVLFGQLAIVLGKFLKWDWVHNRWFRVLHITMIGVVVVESLLSIECPLTTWEWYLRGMGGETASAQSFVGALVHRVLFVRLSPATLTVIYTVFGGIVLLSWFWVPVRWARSAQVADAGDANV